jgi:hypothetical protein
MLGGRKPVHADLLLLDGGFLYRVPNLLNTVEDLISGDSDRLDEELVAASSIGGGLCLHHLKEDGNLNLKARLDAPRVGPDTILFGSGGLDLEGHRGVVGVFYLEDLTDFVLGKRPAEAQLGGIDLDGHVDDRNGFVKLSGIEVFGVGDPGVVVGVQITMTPMNA